MPFSSGTFSLYTPGNPVVAGTTIAVSWANNTLNDIATGLTTCLLKDGSQTVTANIPMAGFKFTGLGAGSAAADSVRMAQVVDSALSALSAVAGTNTITATGGAALSAYASGQEFHFIPAGTNTGATTLNITPSGASALGAKNVFYNGAALAGGEIVSGVPCVVIYDGTQFNIVSNTRLLLGTEQATTSGTAINWTSVPSWVRRITINLVAVSVDASVEILLQIGDTDGLENTGYAGAVAAVTNAAATTGANHSAGFTLTSGLGAAGVLHGRVTLEMEDASDFTWTCTSTLGQSNAATVHNSGGSKSLSAALDRFSLVLSGAGNFDAGAVNVTYQ